MANEITVTVQGTLINGSLRSTFAPGSIQEDQGAQELWSNVVSVGTSEEDITIPDVTTPGRVFMLNLDATNYVTWGPKSGGSMISCGKLAAGDGPTTFKLAGSVTLRMQANTAACKVLMWVSG